MPPRVQAALLCEKVLIEKDGSFSLIRVIDRVLTTNVPTEASPLLWVAYLMVCVRPSVGDPPAAVRVQIDIIGPSGKRGSELDQTVAMDAYGGVNINTMLALNLGGLGVYSFVVSLDGQEASRLTLDVKTGAAPAGAPALVGGPAGDKR